MESQRKPPDFVGIDDSNEQAKEIPFLRLGSGQIWFQPRQIYRVAVLQPRDRLVSDVSGFKTLILPKLNRQKDPKIR